MTRTAYYAVAAAAAFALLLCAPLSALAFRGAGQGPGYGPGCREPGIFWCIGSLDLTEQQRADIDALQRETRARIAPLREELRDLEVPEALYAPSIDTAALEALLARKKSINAEIIDIRHEAMIAAVQLLTPEQRAIMLERKNTPPMYGGRGRGWGGPAGRPGCPRW